MYGNPRENRQPLRRKARENQKWLCHAGPDSAAVLWQHCRHGVRAGIPLGHQRGRRCGHRHCRGAGAHLRFVPHARAENLKPQRGPGTDPLWQVPRHAEKGRLLLGKPLLRGHQPRGPGLLYDHQPQRLHHGEPGRKQKDFPEDHDLEQREADRQRRAGQPHHHRHHCHLAHCGHHQGGV